MKIQLIEGEFNSNDALELITQMINVKINFHEGKISQCDHEEDVKARETKIVHLQNQLNDFRNEINKIAGRLKISGTITLE